MALIVTRNSLNSIRYSIRPNRSFKVLSGHQLLAPSAISVAGIVSKRDFFRHWRKRDTFLHRAYDKSRAYLALHFVVGEYRMENYVSLAVIVFVSISFVFTMYLDFVLNEFHGADHDVNKIPQKTDAGDEKKS